MKQTLEIRIELLSMNEIIATSKRHWSKYASPKKRYDAIIAAISKQQLKPVKNYPVEIHCHWVAPNRRKDPDNLAAGIKFLLDGLVKAKILRGDGWNDLKEIRHTFEVDKKNVGVVVTLSY